MRLTHAKNLQFELLICHHSDGKFGEPRGLAPDYLPVLPHASSSATWAWTHKGKVSKSKDMKSSAWSSFDFRTWKTKDERYAWQAGGLQGNASNPLVAKWGDCWSQGKSTRTGGNKSTMEDRTLTPKEQDLAIHLEQARLRRAADNARREAPTSCRWIAPDTAQLLAPILNEAGETQTRVEIPGGKLFTVTMPTSSLI